MVAWGMMPDSSITAPVSARYPASIMGIKNGDKVTFRPEWRDEGDELIEFRAMEDEDGDRVRVGAIGVLHSFTPVQIVLTSMLETE